MYYKNLKICALTFPTTITEQKHPESNKIGPVCKLKMSNLYNKFVFFEKVCYSPEQEASLEIELIFNLKYRLEDTMADTFTTINDLPVLVCDPDGKKLTDEAGAVELIGEAMSVGAKLIIVPVERLEDDFFQLKTRIAGHIVQKFVTYQRQLIILGDISQHLENSRALRDFVYEANKGDQIWFVTNLQELNDRFSRST